jgi:hypothetical protein
LVVSVAGVVASAFCLFLIQPLVAKRILPVLGGSAHVWAVCLVFFQAALLAGYGYASLLAARLRPAAQFRVHMGLCALALGSLPLASAPLHGIDVGAPSLEVLLLLARSVGVPYVLLASSSPLLQHWFALRFPARRNWRLFAVSNFACAVALLAFPFWLERTWALPDILRFWQVAVVAAVALHIAAAWSVRRLEEPPVVPSPPARLPVVWFWLALLGSALLLTVTGYLTSVVAPFPLLWVLPLFVYLMTFVVVFEGERYRSAWGVPVGFGGLLLMAWALMYLPPARMMGLGVLVWTAGLFAACLMLHGELWRRRPANRELTPFYLSMAAGGAIGSLLLGIAAPLALAYPVELSLTLALAAFTAVSLLPRRRPWFTVAVAAAGAVALAAPAEWAAYGSGTLAATRNFHDALRITQRTVSEDRPPLRSIVHGTVNHGAQYTTGEWRRRPLTYFHERTGAGIMMTRPGPPRRVGVVGLGAGTLAAYGRDGDVFRFYELNPAVIDMAIRHFTYMQDTPAHVEVIPGDARVMMEREQPQNYDMLVVDAFTGDSVPAHLLTREAFEVYLRHLKPEGTLALHVSNRYLNLPPVVQAVSASLGLRSGVISSAPDEETGAAGAVWVMVDRGAAEQSPIDPRLLWTDDFSSLLPILR